MQKQKQYITISTICALASLPAFNSWASKSEPALTSKKFPDYYNFKITPEVGTTGAGGTVGWRLSKHFGVGAGMDYFEYSLNGTVSDNQYNIDLRLMSEPLTLNWYPWSHSSFHVSLGALLNQNDFKGTADNITINNTTYNSINMDIKQQPVCPSLTIGGNFFYFDSAHRWAMGGELGVVYTGDPRVSLNGVNNPSDYQKELNDIKSAAKNLQFWPVLKLNLSYSF